jgi:hypothetical protein
MIRLRIEQFRAGTGSAPLPSWRTCRGSAGLGPRLAKSWLWCTWPCWQGFPIHALLTRILHTRQWPKTDLIVFERATSRDATDQIESSLASVRSSEVCPRLTARPVRRAKRQHLNDHSLEASESCFCRLRLVHPVLPAEKDARCLAALGVSPAECSERRLAEARPRARPGRGRR